MDPRWRKHASSRSWLILAGGFVAAALLPWLTPLPLQLAMLACLMVILLVLLMTLAESFWTLTDQAGPAASALVRRKGAAASGPLPPTGCTRCATSASTSTPSVATWPSHAPHRWNESCSRCPRDDSSSRGTETWRMPYERLLRSPGLYLYRSIAFLKTANYWQDEPGRQSMQVNFELAGDGKLNIERIAIVPDHLWPPQERFPVEPIHSWLQAQHLHSITVKLVRQSSLTEEPDLVTDMGLYGNRAVGQQEIDDRGRTVQFTLTFDFPEVLAAEQRWERLSIYAISYAELLDRSAPGA